MPVPTDCTCSYPATINVQVPGPAGTDGQDGAPGKSGGVAIITSPFIIPNAVGGTVVVAVDSTAPFVTGQNVFCGGANFQVSFIADSQHMTLTYLGLTSSDAAPNTNVSAATLVCPGTGLLDFIPIQSIAQVPDASGGSTSAGATATVGVQQVIIPLTSLVTGLGTGAVTVLNAYTLGCAFKLLSLTFVPTIAYTGSGASQPFTMKIGSTAVTGTLTLALADSLWTPKSAALSGSNVGASTDTISLVKGSGGTVFTAGAGYFIVSYQNLDTVNALSTLAYALNAVLSLLAG